MDECEEGPRRCTRLDYCQFLLSSQINYTLTHLAAHTAAFSHDAATRYLAGDHVTPRDLWAQVRGDVIPSPTGYALFDDTVLNKAHSRHMALVRRQWSGNEHHVIRGIGRGNFRCRSARAESARRPPPVPDRPPRRPRLAAPCRWPGSER